MPGSISSEALRTLFNSALAVQFSQYLAPGMDPVINVNMHPEVGGPGRARARCSPGWSAAKRMPVDAAVDAA
jgi:hypothetical protein